MLIVVAFLVVKIFGFWVIARNPPDGIWRKLVEIVPTGLPELPKTSRTSQNLRKTKILETKMFENPPGSLTTIYMWAYVIFFVRYFC